jgi:hypothetical protein
MDGMGELDPFNYNEGTQNLSGQGTEDFRMCDQRKVANEGGNSTQGPNQ